MFVREEGTFTRQFVFQHFVSQLKCHLFVNIPQTTLLYLSWLSWSKCAKQSGAEQAFDMTLTTSEKGSWCIVHTSDDLKRPFQYFFATEAHTFGFTPSDAISPRCRRTSNLLLRSVCNHQYFANPTRKTIRRTCRIWSQGEKNDLEIEWNCNANYYKTSLELRSFPQNTDHNIWQIFATFNAKIKGNALFQQAMA